MNALILTEQELRRSAVIDETSLQAVENAFTWLSEGKAYMPPIMHIEVADHNGDVDIKSAYVAGLDRFAVKIGSGFFDNPSRDLPSSSAMMVLLSAATGFCEAVLLDNGYLTDLRTGLAGAVAARYLARSNISTVGVVGAGVQARYQVECMTLVREFDRLLVLGRDPERQAGYIDEMQRKLGITVATAESMEQLVRESDLVITATSSRTPLIHADWLHPGLHITAIGSDLAGKQELDAGVLAAADLLVCDRKSQCFSMGELQHGLAAGILTEESAVVELGELTSAGTAGRSSDRQVTICDLTGTGAQDTAIATVAYDVAVSHGIGTVISN